jgi:glutaredoxin 3
MPEKIEIYGTTSCNKCVNVRQFLDEKNIVYTDYMIDLMPLEKDDMIRRCGLKYYPQIFINDKHIGGEEDLLMLDYEGKLQELLSS